MPFSYSHKSRGFTLVEMVITIAILSIGLVAILRSFLNVSFVLYGVKDQIDALSLVESKLNEAILENMENPLDLKNQGNLTESFSLELNNKKATGLMDFSIVLEDPPYYLYEASASLSWLEGKKEKGVSLSTYFSEGSF